MAFLNIFLSLLQPLFILLNFFPWEKTKLHLWDGLSSNCYYSLFPNAAEHKCKFGTFVWIAYVHLNSPNECQGRISNKYCKNISSHLEKIFMKRLGNNLRWRNQQFGENTDSTTMSCTKVLKEVPFSLQSECSSTEMYCNN